MQIAIINGPNLNLLSKREVEIYGYESFDTYFTKLQQLFHNVTFSYFQSNIEGEIINEIQQRGFYSSGIVINAGGYSHTSVAIADAIAAIPSPAVEVHISNIYAREEYRHSNLLAAKCCGVIAGLGLESYRLAIEYLLETCK